MPTIKIPGQELRLEVSASPTPRKQPRAPQKPRPLSSRERQQRYRERQDAMGLSLRLDTRLHPDATATISRLMTDHDMTARAVIEALLYLVETGVITDNLSTANPRVTR